MPITAKVENNDWHPRKKILPLQYWKSCRWVCHYHDHWLQIVEQEHWYSLLVSRVHQGKLATRFILIFLHFLFFFLVESTSGRKKHFCDFFLLAWKQKEMNWIEKEKVIRRNIFSRALQKKKKSEGPVSEMNDLALFFLKIC